MNIAWLPECLLILAMQSAGQRGIALHCSSNLGQQSLIFCHPHWAFDSSEIEEVGSIRLRSEAAKTHLWANAACIFMGQVSFPSGYS